MPTLRDALAHLSAEPVDVVVLDTTVDDGEPVDALVELNRRHPALPVIAIADSAAVASLLWERGAVDVLFADETARVGPTVVRAVRDAGLSRALRSAHDELHGVLLASDRHLDLLAHAPALLWSTDDTLIVRTSDGLDVAGDGAGIALADWDARASEAARCTIVDAHRRALAGETLTIQARWFDAPRYISVGPVRDGSGRVSGTSGAAVACGDISPARAREFDASSDFASHRIVEHRVSAALRDARVTGERVAVFFVDVDRFKTVNDLGGHAAGDAVLRSIADRLRDVIGARGSIARYDGDAFVVVCAGLLDPAQGTAISDAIRGSFGRPFQYGEHDFHLTASVGLSFAPDDADDAERLLANAEAAVREAKRRGRNLASRYIPSILATPTDRHRLQRELSHAIERDQLLVAYQPVYDLRSGRVVSAEALVRWNHPTLGTIVPDRFIPMAEESGLIDSIGEWMIVRVCEQIRRWVDAGIPNVHVSVNVSARQLDRSGLLKFIASAIAAERIAPSSLEIEVTETSIMRDVYAATLVLRDLHATGVRIAIDDFGAGYTSLGFLRNLPIDDLKIDRSFVRDVATGGFDGAVVRAVVMLARELSVRTIAEGVEDAAQMEALRELQCDAVQGFYCAAPMPADDCTPVLRERIA